MKRTWLASATIIYGIFLAFIFLGEVYYQNSLRFNAGKISAQAALTSVNRAILLNPLNAEYRYQKYFILKEAGVVSFPEIKQAIELEPLKPAYHMYYGLALLEHLPGDKFSALIQLRLAKKELSRAAGLKPYSDLYKKTYDTYSAWIDEQL